MNMKKRFPITFKGKQALPEDTCNYCHKGSTSREFVSLAVGATQDTAKDKTVDMSHAEATMSFGWQGPADRSGTGFEVFAKTADGGVCLNFCTTRCLRSFLNDCVDHLEYLMKKTESEPPPRTLRRVPRRK
jgi:hypothetical protein